MIHFIYFFILQEAEAAAAGGGVSKYTCLEVSCTDGLRTIKLNRPKKKNAISWDVSLVLLKFVLLIMG